MFSEEDIQTAMKPRSTSLIGRETPIKTTMRHLSEWPSSKDKRKVPARVQKREPSRAAGGNANWCSRRGEQYASSSRNEKENPVTSLLSIYPEKPKMLL